MQEEFVFVEVKITTDVATVVHTVDFLASESVAAHVEDMVKTTTSHFDEDDTASVSYLRSSSSISCKCGSDWEYHLEVLVLSTDDIDFDPEYDDMSKYSLQL